MANKRISELPSATTPLSGSEELEIVQGGINKKVSTADVGATNTNGHVIEDEGTPLTQRSKLNFVGSGVAVTDDSDDDATVVTVGGGSGEYWRTVPGTPTRVGDTSFTITDTANANLYNFLLGRKTVLRWTDTTDHLAMVVSATYSSNTVTVTIFGDVLSGTATMSSMKYAIQKAEIITFAVAGNVAQANDISRKFFINCETKIFGGKANHGTAGTTNATTYDINKNGTTMFTTKLSVASAATVGSDTTADDDMSASNNDVITVDCDSNSTIYAIDAYVDLYVFPKRNLQLT